MICTQSSTKNGDKVLITPLSNQGEKEKAALNQDSLLLTDEQFKSNYSRHKFNLIGPAEGVATFATTFPFGDVILNTHSEL